MSIVVNGSGTVTGISVGGLPDGIVDDDMIATAAKAGPALGTSHVIRTNAQTISENITIPSTTNGMSAGPIEIADGYTVTVDGNWSIV
jgi:hypothetical protein